MGLRHSERKNGGFTLVEIMIVVLILGILISIAVPNFIRARAEARYQTVMADLKSLNDAETQWRNSPSVSASQCPAPSNISPSFIARFPNPPVGGTAYSFSGPGCTPSLWGRTSDEWATLCKADPSQPACGL